MTDMREAHTFECNSLVAMLAGYFAVFYLRLLFSLIQKTGVTPLSVACIMGELPIVHQLVHALRLKLSGSRHVKNHRKAVSV